jgi:hypothetical protein
MHICFYLNPLEFRRLSLDDTLASECNNKPLVIHMSSSLKFADCGIFFFQGLCHLFLYTWEITNVTTSDTAVAFGPLFVDVNNLNVSRVLFSFPTLYCISSSSFMYDDRLLSQYTRLWRILSFPVTRSRCIQIPCMQRVKRRLDWAMYTVRI